MCCNATCSISRSFAPAIHSCNFFSLLACLILLPFKSRQASKLSVFFCPIFEGAPLSNDPKPPLPPTTRRERDTKNSSSPLSTASSSNSRCEQANLCSWQGMPSKSSMCCFKRETGMASLPKHRDRVLPPCNFTNICIIDVE